MKRGENISLCQRCTPQLASVDRETCVHRRIRLFYHTVNNRSQVGRLLGYEAPTPWLKNDGEQRKRRRRGSSCGSSSCCNDVKEGVGSMADRTRNIADTHRSTMIACVPADQFVFHRKAMFLQSWVPEEWLDKLLWSRQRISGHLLASSCMRGSYSSSNNHTSINQQLEFNAITVAPTKLKTINWLWIALLLWDVDCAVVVGRSVDNFFHDANRE